MISSSVGFSPRLVVVWRSSAAEMKPLSSLSKTLKASRISSSESVSFLRDGGGVEDHADGALHLGEVAAGRHRRGLMVDAAVDAGGAPVHELDVACEPAFTPNLLISWGVFTYGRRKTPTVPRRHGGCQPRRARADIKWARSFDMS